MTLNRNQADQKSAAKKSDQLSAWNLRLSSELLLPADRIITYHIGLDLLLSCVPCPTAVVTTRGTRVGDAHLIKSAHGHGALTHIVAEALLPAIL